MLLKESRTQPGGNSSAQSESQAEISLSVGAACEGPAQGGLPVVTFWQRSQAVLGVDVVGIPD